MLCLLQVKEPVCVPALSPEPPVEAFYERIIGRLARSGEVDLHAIPVGPQVHGLTGKLTAVIAEQHFRYAAVELQSVQRTHNVVSFQALSNFDGCCFSYVHIDDRQRAEPGTLLKLICYEVHAPSLVWRCGLEPLFAVSLIHLDYNFLDEFAVHFAKGDENKRQSDQ